MPKEFKFADPALPAAPQIAPEDRPIVVTEQVPQEQRFTLRQLQQQKDALKEQIKALDAQIADAKTALKI